MLSGIVMFSLHLNDKRKPENIKQLQSTGTLVEMNKGVHKLWSILDTVFLMRRAPSAGGEQCLQDSSGPAEPGSEHVFKSTGVQQRVFLWF